MKKHDPKSITRAEFYGMMVAVFSFIFAVHMSRKIIFPWFFNYITGLIILVQCVSLYAFLKYVRKSK